MSADESNSWFSNIAEPPGLEDSTDGSTMLSMLAGLIATAGYRQYPDVLMACRDTDAFFSFAEGTSSTILPR